MERFQNKMQASSPVVARWNLHMQDLMEMVKDPETGQLLMLEQVFLHG